MTWVKVDEGLISITRGKTSSEIATANDIIEALKALRDDAKNDVQAKLDSKSGDDYDAAEITASQRKGSIDDCYDRAVECVGKIVSKYGSVDSKLGEILTSVTTFNALAQVKEEVLKKALADQMGEGAFDIRIETNPNGGDDTPIIYYKIGDKEYTISELLNAFYTYTGMSMNTQIQGDILRESLGLEVDS